MRDLEKDRAFLEEMVSKLESDQVQVAHLLIAITPYWMNQYEFEKLEHELIKQESEILKHALKQVINSSRESVYTEGTKEIFNSHGHYMAVHIAKEALKGD